MLEYILRPGKLARSTVSFSAFISLRWMLVGSFEPSLRGPPTIFSMTVDIVVLTLVILDAGSQKGHEWERRSSRTTGRGRVWITIKVPLRELIELSLHCTYRACAGR